MHSLVPLLGFGLLLFGHVGLLDGDDPKRLRRCTGRVRVQRHQHAIAGGDAREVESLSLGQVRLTRRDALQLRGRGTSTWFIWPASVFTVSVSPLMAVTVPR